MKKNYILAFIAIGLLAGGIVWSNTLAQKDPGIIMHTGMHWHPRLTIYVKGVKQEIPANTGIGSQYSNTPGYDPQMQMAAIHTHEDLPLIHLEFMSGPVRREDIALGQFFKIWGKDMRSFGTNMRMTVNGKENTAYGNYMMRDGDLIELRYD